MALEMRPACELCVEPLPHDAVAYVCSFECTFCEACAKQAKEQCPNCAGELVRRPRRVPQTR